MSLNQVHLVTMTLDGVAVYHFVCAGDLDHSGYVAGVVLDRLADATGKTFGYKVEPIPYASTMTSPHVVAVEAVAAVTQ